MSIGSTARGMVLHSAGWVHFDPGRNAGETLGPHTRLGNDVHLEYKAGIAR